MKKIFITSMLFLFGITFLCAQETNPTTGGNANGSGGIVSYSIGQIFYNTISVSNGTIIQGVQQPFEISVVTAIKNTEYINLRCVVYPNPTSGYLKLSVESETFNDMKFYLFNMSGVRLQEDKVLSKETEIQMENYPSSTYILKIVVGNKEIKSFKIIKN